MLLFLPEMTYNDVEAIFSAWSESIIRQNFDLRTSSASIVSLSLIIGFGLQKFKGMWHSLGQMYNCSLGIDQGIEFMRNWAYLLTTYSNEDQIRMKNLRIITYLVNKNFCDEVFYNFENDLVTMQNLLEDSSHVSSESEAEKDDGSGEEDRKDWKYKIEVIKSDEEEEESANSENESE
jgi:hypothetical protein